MQIAPELTEKQFAGQIRDLAQALGWLRYHTYRSERSPAGFPDEVLTRDRVVYLELKTSKGKPSPFQIEWLDRLAVAGAEVYLARPADLDELAQVLSQRWQLLPPPGDGRPCLSDGSGYRYFLPRSLWIPGLGRSDTQEQQTLLTKGALA